MKYRAKRDCFYGLQYRYQGHVYELDDAPEDLFEPVDSSEKAVDVEAPKPGGASISEVEKSAMVKAGRNTKAARKE